MARSSSPIIQISRKGLFIWIGLVVFIAAWMFVLGVMVGRGMAPVNLEAGKLEQELAELKARMLKEKQAAEVSAAADHTDEKAQLGFYEALKNPGKEAAFRPTPPQKPLRSRTSAAKTAAPKSVSTAKTRKPTATRTASGSKPESASNAGSFAVQVASVQDIKGADRMVAALRAKGYPAYLIRSDVAGKGIWYRIRVGGFEDRGAAAKMLAKLKNDKFGGMVVRTK